MPTIAICNQKGGVGKTTTACNIGAGLAERGHRTLLIDMDPQANATTGLGWDEDDLAEPGFRSMADVLEVERGRMAEVISGTRHPNLKVAPSHQRLHDAAEWLNGKNFREQFLQRALASVAGNFDYVVIDCAPSIGVLTVNALVAADKILIPSDLSGYALGGIADLLKRMEGIKPDGIEFRILLTKVVSGQAAIRQATARMILENIKGFILAAQIGRYESIERSQMPTDTQERLTPVILQTKWTKGAQDYRAVVEELIKLWPPN